MRVLCPIDFSSTSVITCRWIANILNHIEDGALHLTHFIHINKRASMFISIDQILMERAQEDMLRLSKKLESKFPNIVISTSTYSGHPKDGIVQLANQGEYDLIVTGTTGLDAIKNMTIGSVTEYIFEHCTIPVLAIPESVQIKEVKNIALAVDDEHIKKVSTFTYLRAFTKLVGGKLYLTHVTGADKAAHEYDPGIDMILRNVDYKYTKLSLSGSISSTLFEFCKQKDIDILCLIHHRRNWVQKLFHKSTVKSGLFKIELPMLILNELDA